MTTLRPAPRFSGIWIPLVTPMTADGTQIDLLAAQRLADFYINAGVAGLVVCGTTGEAATLSEAEQDGLLAAILETAQRRCGVVMGAGGSDTETLARRIRQFDADDLAALLIAPPPYVKPSQQGILAHYTRLAAATHHPIVLYNIPSRTGVNLELATVSKLAASGRFPALKESSGNIPHMINLIEAGALDVLAGDDSLLLVTLLMGGAGAISASAHIRPDLFVALCDCVRQGRYGDAQTLARQLQPLIHLLFSEPNPAPVKTLLALQGRIHDSMRLPMVAVSAATRAALKAELARLEGVQAPPRIALAA